MPRLPGGPATDLPHCPRPGHASRRVTKDGRYGSPERQLFRCLGNVINERTGEVRGYHRFAPETPRVMTASGVCDTCESEVHTHAGPLAGRTWGFPLREVASAFVAVGTGASYAQAADRSRVASRRQRLKRDRGGPLVAEWLDLLGPVVLDAYAESAWPETLVLDRTWFMVKNKRTGAQSLAFNVLGAYGYTPDGKGRVWGLYATHHATHLEWEEFLRTLDVSVPPRLVVCDGDEAIINAVRAVWPPAPGDALSVPFVKRCELHLHRNGLDAMAQDNIGGHLSYMRRRLGTAFLRSEGWDELVDRSQGYTATQSWLAGIAADVSAQVAVRHLLPQHHSTAALDQALGRVRDFLDSRSFVLRNKRRTNALLGLVRNHLNGIDVERHYFQVLRDHLDTSGGRLPSQRTGYDRDAGPRTDRADRVPASLRA